MPPLRQAANVGGNAMNTPMKQLFLVMLITTGFSVYAQNHSICNDFNNLVMEVEGDLNNDKLLDKAVVTQDTSCETAPYRLQIYFQQSNRQLKLIVTSTNIIEAQYPNGRNGYKTGDRFSNISIDKGLLYVNFELLRGHYEHKFRFGNGNFELIAFSMSSSDGRGELYSTDFNLLTGIRVEKIERYDLDKVVSKKVRTILIRPLPKLQDLVPLDTDLY